MALDSVVLNPGLGGSSIGVDNIGGIDYELVKMAYGDVGSITPVSPTNPLPVAPSLPINAAIETGGNLAAILAKLSSDPATQTTLAAILAKIISAPATAANQATEITSLANLDVALSTRLKPADTLTAVTTVGTITNTVNTSEVAPTAILNGKTTVATAGSRVVLASTTPCKSVTIKALSTNAGFIYVGNSTVTASNGFQLLAGDSISFDIANLNTVNIDSSINGESCTYIAVN